MTNICFYVAQNLELALQHSEQENFEWSVYTQICTLNFTRTRAARDTEFPTVFDVVNRSFERLNKILLLL